MLETVESTVSRQSLNTGHDACLGFDVWTSGAIRDLKLEKKTGKPQPSGGTMATTMTIQPGTEAVLPTPPVSPLSSPDAAIA